MNPASFAIAFAVLLLGPTIAKNIVAKAIVGNKEKKVFNKALESSKLNFEEDESEKIELQRNPKLQTADRLRTVDFRNVRTGEINSLNVREDISFNLDEDILLHGRLHVTDGSGHRTVQDIYLFQPRLFSANALLGPKLDKNNNLSEEYTYLCRKPGTKDILTGYVPKREIFSGMRYDFVTNGKHSFIERNPQLSNSSKKELDAAKKIEKFIYIDIPTDSNGEFIPVNLDNKEEAEAFRQYIVGHMNNTKTPKEHFVNQIKEAEVALSQYLMNTIPDYARAIKQKPKDETILKVEKAAEPKTSINDFYKRYDYYLNPNFGEEYNHYHSSGTGAPTHHPPHRR